MFKPFKRSGAGERIVRVSALVVFTLAFLLVAASSSWATPIPITDLVDQNLTITQGDKRFSDFLVVFNPQGPGPTAPPDASGIWVEGITIGANHGLEFSGGMFAGANASLDILIQYTVTVWEGPELISDINLIFNGAVTGDGFTNVVETVLDGVDVIGQAEVTNPPPVLSQTVFLDYLVQTAVVKKDIFLTGGTNGTATISFIDQAISQSSPPVEVPEPSTLFLLGAGILGFIRFGRRRLR